MGNHDPQSIHNQIFEWSRILPLKELVVNWLHMLYAADSPPSESVLSLTFEKYLSYVSVTRIVITPRIPL